MLFKTVDVGPSPPHDLSSRPTPGMQQVTDLKAEIDRLWSAESKRANLRSNA